MRLRIIRLDGTTDEREFAAQVVRLGRDASSEVPFDAAKFPKVSSLHAQIENTPNGVVLTHKSQSNKTLLNDQPIDGTVSLNPGDRIRLGYSGPIVQLIASTASSPVPNQVWPEHLESSAQIKITCPNPNCNARLKVAGTEVGKLARCPGCATLFPAFESVSTTQPSKSFGKQHRPEVQTDQSTTGSVSYLHGNRNALYICSSILLVGVMVCVTIAMFSRNKRDRINLTEIEASTIAEVKTSTPLVETKTSTPPPETKTTSTPERKSSGPMKTKSDRPPIVSDPMASATKDAWNTLYRTDTKALTQWGNDVTAALDTIIAGYRVDSVNVDRELLSFIDEHIAVAGNLATIKRNWVAALEKVDRDAELQLQKAIDNLYRPLSLLADNPQAALEASIAGHRIGMQLDIRNAKEKVNKQFIPKDKEAWNAFAESIGAKNTLAQALALRYKHDFRVGLALKSSSN